MLGDLNLEALIRGVKERGTNEGSRVHGEHHWQCVAWTGAQLVPLVPGCDPLVVFLFGVVHDVMRISDGYDPDHGRRAGALARGLNGSLFRLTSVQLGLLDAACCGHADGGTSDDPTIGVCWDADRLNLWRCAITPAPELLSTKAARDPGRIAWAEGLQGQEFRWEEIWEVFVGMLQG